MKKSNKGTKMSLAEFNATTSKSPISSTPKPVAWGIGSDMSKLRAIPPPVPPVPITMIESRVGTQTREFSTLAGDSRRSNLVSRRHEERINTIMPGASTYTSGPWVHIKDTARSHTHPGGVPHVPTNAAGGFEGLETTPEQRKHLDKMSSTTSESTTVWDN